MSAQVGLPGCLSAMLFFIESVATYTIGCSFPPPVRHGACHRSGWLAMNEVKEFSTGYAAIHARAVFGRPIVSSGADFSLDWLTNCSRGCLPALLSWRVCLRTRSPTSPSSGWNGPWSIYCSEPVQSKSRTAVGTVRACQLCLPLLEVRVAVMGEAGLLQHTTEKNPSYLRQLRPVLVQRDAL